MESAKGKINPESRGIWMSWVGLTYLMYSLFLTEIFLEFTLDLE
jgi:hypothetical protein